MEWVETTGRSVEEAKEAALDRLGVGEDDAEFELLAEPKSGLFGRIRSEARVRARVRPTRPRPKDDRREHRRRSRQRGGSHPKGSAEPAAVVDAPAKGRRSRGNGAKTMEDDASVAEQGEMARLFVAELVERFGVQGTAEVAEQVRESGSEQQLEPMTPPDRKVIHDTVNVIDGVVTRSEGLEPDRRVVVASDGG